MKQHSLYNVTFRNGPEVSIIADSLSTAMVDAVVVVNEWHEDEPTSRQTEWLIADIQGVFEMNREVYVSPSLMYEEVTT